MLPQLFREVCPLFELGHLPTEYHLAEFLSESFSLLRIVRGSKSFDEFEKRFLLLSLRLDPLFNKFNKHTIGTQPPTFCHATHLSGNL